MLQMENYQGNTDYNLLEDSDIVNNLTSSDTNKALSALQGKNLNDILNTLQNTKLGGISKIVVGKLTTRVANNNDTWKNLWNWSQMSEILGQTVNKSNREKVFSIWETSKGGGSYPAVSGVFYGDQFAMNLAFTGSGVPSSLDIPLNYLLISFI